MYGLFAELYDGLMYDVDYNQMANFIKKRLKSYSINSGLVLDLACGTGCLTRLLAESGYDMTGVDLSEEMLGVAKQKSNENILYLCQNMASFELYGTMRAIICTMDGFNYLTEKEEFLKTLKLCHNYLDPDGILLFDVNSEYKFKNVLNNNTFVYDSEDIFYTWENDFNDENGLCDFYLTFFVKNDDLSYTRINEEQTERAYSEKEIEEMLLNAGFKVCNKFNGYTEKNASEKSERILYECKKTEENKF